MNLEDIDPVVETLYSDDDFIILINDRKTIEITLRNKDNYSASIYVGIDQLEKLSNACDYAIKKLKVVN